nr:MAG TPA: hypothetical protein [Caudoviricetes sp.]DAT46804.1 MAG TPA: hypothetical protein [Caudoviricetes sp.]DAZ38527.1 MAG TPA: hypothetical protein [Caudoviricetes sp.]
MKVISRGIQSSGNSYFIYLFSLISRLPRF